MKTLIAIITLALLHITSPMAQVTSVTDSHQIDELGILEFMYDSRSQSYVILTDIYIDEDLDESDYKLTLCVDKEINAQNLPNKEDIQPLFVGSHQFTYNVDYEGRLILNLFNPNGGTPWSTLNSDALTLTLTLQNDKFQGEQIIVDHPRDQKNHLARLKNDQQ